MTVPVIVVANLATFGVELAKLLLQDAALKRAAAAAGISPEATEAAVVKARAEFAALPDPAKLPEV
jgi:hypothetical protein